MVESNGAALAERKSLKKRNTPAKKGGEKKFPELSWLSSGLANRHTCQAIAGVVSGA